MYPFRLPIGPIQIPPRPVGGRLAASVETVAAPAADFGFGPAGAAILLGHFWVTYCMTPQSKAERNVMITDTEHGEILYSNTGKYDTFQKNSLS